MKILFLILKPNMDELGKEYEEWLDEVYSDFTQFIDEEDFSEQNTIITTDLQ